MRRLAPERSAPPCPARDSRGPRRTGAAPARLGFRRRAADQLVEHDDRVLSRDRGDRLAQHARHRPRPVRSYSKTGKEIALEAHQPLEAARVHGAREARRAELDRSPARAHRLVEPREQDHALDRRARRGHQQTVVAPRVRAGNGRHRPAAEPVGLQPLEPRRALEVAENGTLDHDAHSSGPWSIASLGDRSTLVLAAYRHRHFGMRRLRQRKGPGNDLGGPVLDDGRRRAIGGVVDANVAELELHDRRPVETTQRATPQEALAEHAPLPSPRARSKTGSRAGEASPPRDRGCPRGSGRT